MAPPARCTPAKLKTAPSEIVTGPHSATTRPRKKSEKFKRLPAADGSGVQQGDTHRASAQTRTRRNRPENAVAFGAVGIGLTRTEHMFFEGDRIDVMREMILADHGGRAEGRAGQAPAVSSVKTSRASSSALKGYPATIRLPGSAAPRVPAAHEGVNRTRTCEEDGRRRGNAFIHRVAQNSTSSTRCSGHRGCRLGIGYPEISEMQARAVFEAAAQVAEGRSIKVRNRRVMIPLVGFKKELDLQIEVVHKAAPSEVHGGARRSSSNYLVGTMIEVPRGALTADEIAQVSRVLQLRHQRPDADRRLACQPRRHRVRLPACTTIENWRSLTKNPFATIDATGVGQLVEMAVEEGTQPHARTSSSASAANTVVIRIPSSSATRSA